MAEQGLAQSAPLEVGPAPGEEPPRKRLRHEDHEVRCCFGATSLTPLPPGGAWRADGHGS